MQSSRLLRLLSINRAFRLPRQNVYYFMPYFLQEANKCVMLCLEAACTLSEAMRRERPELLSAVLLTAGLVCWSNRYIILPSIPFPLLTRGRQRMLLDNQWCQLGVDFRFNIHRLLTYTYNAAQYCIRLL